MTVVPDTTTMPRVRTRFAPSPTGFLHVGAFRTALFSYLLAKKFNGQFVLRIEDTDQNRLVPGALENIVRSLQALGLYYDEGPDKASVAALDAEKYGVCDPSILPLHGGDYGPYFQSQRRERYHEIIDQLLDEGKAYYAFETPEELEAARAAANARKIPYTYNRRYRDSSLSEARERVANGEPAVVRFKMPVTGIIRTVDFLRGETLWDATTQDDFVILKADGLPPYHLAMVVDDHDMQISHVLRGEEWIPSFPKHVCLFQALGWELPVFVHTPNVTGEDGKKLSKRHGANPIIGPAPEYKDGKPTGGLLEGMVNQEGYLPDALVNFLALVGWSPGDDREVMSRDEITRAFDLGGISTSPGKFSESKLKWMNGIYIREHTTPDALAMHTLPFLAEAGLVPTEPDATQREYIKNVIALEQERLVTLSDAPGLCDFFFAPLPEYSENSITKWLRKDGVAAFLTALSSELDQLTDWSAANIETVCREVGSRHGREKGELTHPVRVATTGREKGPGLFELMAVLGRESVHARLAKAIELSGA